MKPIWETFGNVEAALIYSILSAYLNACLAGLRAKGAESSITNPTLFRALLLLFPSIAERVTDRHGQQQFTSAHFDEILAPFFGRLKKGDLQKPPSKLKELDENLRRALRSGFSIGAGAT